MADKLDCVCRPGSPCIWHHTQVTAYGVHPREVPHPENYQQERGGT